MMERFKSADSISALSVSGGKDSLAMWLLAIENGINHTIIFADTGHEHPQTYDYLDYLEHKLGPINRVKADFSEKLKNKHQFVTDNWPDDLKEQAFSVLQPSGIPFIDLCILKGRFPSLKARFCTFELKHLPIKKFMLPLLNKFDEVISWQGVRADESLERAQLTEYVEDADNTPGLNIYRPILHWTVSDVFAIAKKHGIEPNPLYKNGCSRVGCMPCINARKKEMHEIFERWPEQIERLAQWEKLVSKASKRGCSTFFWVGKDSTRKPTKDTIINLETYGIKTYRDWASTDKGGRQYPIFPLIEDMTTCSSIYAGVCE